MEEKVESNDFLLNPLSFANYLYSQHIKTGKKNEWGGVSTHYRDLFDNIELLNKIPCLNQVSIDQIPHNSLIRVKCFSQYLLDPEYHLDIYQTKNDQNGKDYKTGRYQDLLGDVIIF